jgi:hypothetical protein
VIPQAGVGSGFIAHGLIAKYVDHHMALAA